MTLKLCVSSAAAAAAATALLSALFHPVFPHFPCAFVEIHQIFRNVKYSTHTGTPAKQHIYKSLCAAAKAFYGLYSF